MTETRNSNRIEAEIDYQASDYFKLAWAMVRRDPWLVGWRLAADLFSAAARPLTLIWLLLVAGGWTARRVSAGESEFAAAQALLERITQPSFVFAAGGLLLVATLAGFLTDALVSGGIWSTLSDLATGDDVRPLNSFFGHLSEAFPKAAGLRALAAIGEWTVILMGGLVTVTLIDLYARPSALAEASIFVQALIVTVPVFVFFVFAALVRFAFMAAAAPLFVDGVSVGTAIARGARFVIEHLSGVYRLFVFAAGLLLIPLFGLWAISTIQAFAGSTASAAIMPLRLIAQAIVYLSVSVLTLYFEAALFAFYARSEGRSSPFEYFADSDSSPDELPASSTSGGYSRDTTLPDLYPRDPDAGIVSIDDLPLDADLPDEA
jgi:hypothetical protein